MATAPAIEDLRRDGGEPRWLTDLRREAWRRFERLPLPSRQTEGWRRTDVSGVKFDGLVPFARGAGGPGAAGLPGLEGDVLVQRNSTPAHRQVSADLEARGVVFTDLQSAARERGELVQGVLARDIPEDVFTAFNTATWAGGTFLYVPRGVELELPLYSLLEGDHPGLSLSTRTLVVAAPGARVTLLERWGGTVGLHTHVTAVHAGPGAQVRCVCLQNFDPGVKSFAVREAFVADDARVDWLFAETGAGLTRSETTGHLTGRGSRSDSMLLLFGDGRQRLDVGINAILVAPRTSSDTQARSVLSGDARGAYRGSAHIEKIAREGRVYQRHNALLLSDTARNDSSPGLFIDNMEVAAGHAATAGRIDADQLFYLQSRGIDERTAKRMIVEGFLDPVIEAVPAEAMRQELRNVVQRKLNAC